MEHLYGKTLRELAGISEENGLPRFAAKQIADWLYKKGVGSIEDMTNLSKKGRETLMRGYDVGLVKPTIETHSSDGTAKYLFEYDGGSVETAYIPDGRGERNTLCVSSQFGCKMGCRFCMTGRQGFHGHLTTHQILNQMGALETRDELTNMVFMGMGEPMDNLDAVLRSLEILTSDWGYAWSPRRITVSTIGLAKPLKRLLDESQANVAISLHTPMEAQRAELMPVEKAPPIGETIALLRKYDWTGQRRLTFEYTLFSGVNDTSAHATALCNMLKGLRCHVNLICFNPIPDSDLKGTDRKHTEWFRDKIDNHYGITATIRESKGRDIDAACGLLSTKSHKTEVD